MNDTCNLNLDDLFQKRQKLLDETVAIDNEISMYQTAQKPTLFDRNYARLHDSKKWTIKPGLDLENVVFDMLTSKSAQN